FPILHSLDEARDYFHKKSRYFLVAIASPQKRKEVVSKLESVGGRAFTYIACQSSISSHANVSENGVIVQMDCEIGQDVVLEKGVLVNIQTSIGDGVHVGSYTTIAPDVIIMSGASIGRDCIISTGVTIAAGVTIGNNVKIWMGQTVTTDLPDNTNLI
ncbi:MAG: hypothetical protein KBF73_05325, partial [Flavobacteriales bacterium]|nr:hypothetical protein [Flavobacteriales bacterium]